MSRTANVHSVDALKDFKLVLLNYAEEARIALSSAGMELNHARNWLERDQYSHWKTQVKRCQEELASAKTELHRRQLSQMNSDAVSDSDQKDAVREAKRKLAYAEEKVETVKRWVPILQHAVSEYHSQSQPLGDHLTGGFQSTLAALERMIQALEDYLAMAAPEAPGFAPEGGSSGEVTSGPSAGAGPVAAPAAEPSAPPPPGDAEPAPEAPGVVTEEPAASEVGSSQG